MKQKKANLLSIWWFFVLTIIAIGIFIGVYMFYGHKIDIRYLEADILSTRVMNCLVSNGVLNADFENQNFDILTSCSLDNKVFGVGSDYLVKVSLYGAGGLIKEVTAGNSGLEGDCKITLGVKKAEQYPRCSEKSITAVNSTGQTVSLKIFAASNYEKEKF